MEGTFKASSRYLKISPRKLRQVAALVRGKPLAEAIALLRYVPKKAGRFMECALRSVLGNAKDRSKGNAEGLVVRAVRVDEGPQPRDAKRWTPKAMGRVGKLRRRTSHLQVVVARQAGAATVEEAVKEADKKVKKQDGKGAKEPPAKATKKPDGEKEKGKGKREKR